MSYNEDLCGTKHTRVDEILSDHEQRLNGHSQRIDNLEQNDRENHVEIKNLIKKMDSFITVIMWGLGIFVTVSIFVVGIILNK